ncbi:MAG: glutaminase domain-containing protein [Thermoguttaceae bacterium]
MMKNFVAVCVLLVWCAMGLAQGEDLRPASVPLVVVDPYFSIWSPATRLTDRETVHWTGSQHPLHMIARIDGKPYRLMGLEPLAVPAMPQTKLEVRPLATAYTFENETAEIVLTFQTPFLPDDLDALSRPVTYLMFLFIAKDKQKHNVELYFDAGGELAVNNPNESVAMPTTLEVAGTKTMKFGTQEQPILEKKGDGIRIDWGYFVLSVLDIPQLSDLAPHNGKTAREEFAKTGTVTSPLAPANSEMYKVDETGIVLAATWQTNGVESAGGPLAILAYDDTLSVKYFGDDLPAWWRRDGKTFEAMLAESWGKVTSSNEFSQKCNDFENKFYRDLEAVGGEDYAKLCALAYRQVLGAQKIVADVNGMPLMFSKENNSNGCMGTVDLMYPHGPMLLYYSPAMMKATLQPIFDYAESPKWKFSFAPHDIGTYPQGTGQVYGGGEFSDNDQMPVEESANIIILTAALAVAEQRTDYARLHWKTLTTWAQYLLDKGFDPENQLCTDDFAGHLAHNVNLSAKAIVALGAYAQLAEKLGEAETAKEYRQAAEKFAARWVKDGSDSDHTRLAFDRPNTWSMKYNLMWDKVLDMNLFPNEVFEKEIAYYKTQMRPFGLPLDNRALYTKNDWILWTAAMTTNRADFDLFVAPVVRFVNETPERVPLSDWYETDSARHNNFKARSVIGGFWAPMLRDKAKWQAQAKLGANVDESKPWAKILLPGKPIKSIAATARDEKVTWRYTTERPANGWESAAFDDSSWKSGQGGFGVRNTPGAIVGTEWNSSDIWLRRTFEFDGNVPEGAELQLFMHHDDDVEVYLNGERVIAKNGYTSDYTTFTAQRIATLLKKGTNTLAVYCHQDHGGQFIDVGISIVEKVRR